MAKAKTNPLDSALAALRAGDMRGALAHLLVAWRIAPATTELFELVELAPCPPLLARELAGARKVPAQAWLDHARKKDPLELPALLATLLDAGAAVARERLALLLGWKRDPRLEVALATLLDQLPLTSYGAMPFWRDVFDAAPSFRDPRAWNILGKLAPSRGGEKVQRMIRVRAAELRAPAPKVAELSARDRAILTELATVWQAPPPATRADDLLAAVLANPADDDLRLVYADALQAAGPDPHGELIVLQIDRARGTTSAGRRRREKEIQTQHRGRLLGPLIDVVRASSARFDRGFLDRCAVAPPEATTAGNPWWSTVRELDGGNPALVTHAAMSSLESVVSYKPAFVVAIARSAPPRLRSLAVQLDAHSSTQSAWQDMLGALASSTATLANLEFRAWQWASYRPTPGDYAPLFDGPLAGRLQSLRIYAANWYWNDPEGVPIATWLRALMRHPVPPRLELDDQYNLFAFDGGKLVSITCRWGESDAGLYQWAVRGAQSLAAAEIGDVAFKFTSGRVPEGAIEGISAALKR